MKIFKYVMIIIINRVTRGVTYTKVKDTYRNWTKYWNPNKSQYVIVKWDIALPLSQSWNGKITTITTQLTQEFKNSLILK